MKKNEVRALVRLNYSCNNKCLFCHQADYRKKKIKKISLEKILKKAKKQGVTTIELTGGEPTINKDIFKTLLAIKENGIKIGLVSNGRAFFYNYFLEKIISFGVNFFFVSLYSHNFQIHDFLTSQSGSWKQTVKGIDNILKYKSNLDLTVNCVVVNQNIEELEKFIFFLKEKNIKKIKFSFPLLKGEVTKNKDIIPNVNYAGKKISEALMICKENKIEGFYEGLPYCLIKDKYRENVHNLERANIYYRFEPPKNGLRTTSITKNNKKITCLECSFYHSCVNFRLGHQPMKIKVIRKRIPNSIFFLKEKNVLAKHPKSICLDGNICYVAKDDFFNTKNIRKVKKSGNIFKSENQKLYFLKKKESKSNTYFKGEEFFVKKLEKKILKEVKQLRGSILFITENNFYKDKINKNCVVMEPKTWKEKEFLNNFDSSFDYIALMEVYNKTKYLKKELSALKKILKVGGKIIIFERNLYGVVGDEPEEQKNNYRNHSINDCCLFFSKIGFKIKESKDYTYFWKVVVGSC